MGSRTRLREKFVQGLGNGSNGCSSPASGLPGKVRNKKNKIAV